MAKIPIDESIASILVAAQFVIGYCCSACLVRRLNIIYQSCPLCSFFFQIWTLQFRLPKECPIFNLYLSNSSADWQFFYLIKSDKPYPKKTNNQTRICLGGWLLQIISKVPSGLNNGIGFKLTTVKVYYILSN